MGLYCIIAAMDEEHKEILNIMQNVSREKIYEKEFIKGTINSKQCVLAMSGVGKVNAARTAQILIDNYDIDAVINVGSAGALNEGLNYGDLIISTGCVQHDFDITCFDHPKGYITDIGVEISADKKLVHIMKAAVRELDSNIKVVEGIVATGDQFHNSPEIKRMLRKEFHAECDDMEGAAIGQVCMLCNKPFVVVRSISDKPKCKEKVDFYEYLTMASKRCASIIKLALK